VAVGRYYNVILGVTAVNQSTVAAKLRFARNCIAGTRHASPAVAAELRRAAREALAGIGAAAAPHELNPHRSQTQTYAAVVLQALH
jgi:hypothetical protein